MQPAKVLKRATLRVYKGLRHGMCTTNPELINTDPHGDAWLITVRLTDRSETENLMTADEYEAYIKEEKAH